MYIQTKTPSIQVINACLRYRNKILFEQLSVTVEAGKFTCLLGTSGVGKSSLLKLIAGLINSTDSSQAQLTAEVVASDQLSLVGRIAYLAQADSLLPWLSVLENVTLGARLRGEPIDTTYAKQLLTQVGLAKAMKLKPSQLSGGMRQRVAIVRTFLEGKPIVLMDEPFSALDSITRIQLQELAAQLLASKTVLWVTHDPLEALRLGHKIYIMTGQPATITTFDTLPGSPPRQLDDAILLHWYGALVQQLAQQQVYE